MNENITILVIDDNEYDRELYRRLLQKALVSVVCILEASSGESGLKLIESDVPQCVLLDYSLPEYNGIEVLERIRARYPHLPVIMLTGQGNEAIAVQSMKEGAQDYILKSTITPEALQRVIRVAMEHSAMQKSIDEQRASLEIFTRALAHDLKEPVRTMRSFLDRITDLDKLSEKSQRSLKYIHKAAVRMDALIDTVYLYTRLDSAEKMETIACGLDGVIGDVRENLAMLIEERNASIFVDSLPCVQANRVQMIQLFQNLIANAIRHCETAVEIHISSEICGDTWKLIVSDNGSGIAPENLDKIFDPFKRLVHHKENSSGLGLGLAINRKIVESYGGTIWCESTQGKGTAFLFTLPKVEEVAGESNAAYKTPHRWQASGSISPLARILIVDDNDADIELHRIMLLEEGKLYCDVVAACDGREAIMALQSAKELNDPIDIILLDINMPGISGFELLAEMQKQHICTLPLVVICSTSAYDIDRRMAESLGAVGYLTKPLHFASLMDIITHCGRFNVQVKDGDYLLLRAA